MIKGIIFDLDGTILSTLYDIQESVNIVLKNHGYNLRSYEEIRNAIGRGSRCLIQDSLPTGISEEEIDKYTSEYIDVYGCHYNVKTKPYEGIEQLFNKLEEKNILIAVNSNKPDKYSKNLVSCHFPGNNFIDVIGHREDHPYKPDPSAVYEIIDKMKLNKSEVLYVGDSDKDVETAKNAGIKIVGCLWGFRDLKTLTNAGADYIISKPEELLNYL